MFSYVKRVTGFYDQFRFSKAKLIIEAGFGRGVVVLCSHLAGQPVQTLIQALAKGPTA